MSTHKKPVKRIVLSVLLAAILVFAAFPLYMNAFSVKSIHKTGKNKTAVVNICGHKNFKIKSQNESKVFHHQIKDQACVDIELPIKRKFKDYQFKVLSENDDTLKLQLLSPSKKEQNDYQILVDFANLTINGISVLKNIMPVSNQQPYTYQAKISKTEPLSISLEVRRHKLSLMDLSEKYSISYLILFTVAVLAFLFSYKLINYLANFKLLQHNSRIDIVFLSMFFITLYIPMSYISKEETSPNENRVLAKYPKLLGENGINTLFGKKVENWFNDRFFGRRFMLSTEEKMKRLIEPHRGNKKVMVGKEGWLFYKGGNSVNNFINKSELSSHQMEKGTEYLIAINNWCKAHNKKFYYVLIPDKHRIYGEYVQYIQKIRPDSESMDNQWVNYIRNHSDVNVLYLYDILMQNKGKDLLYWKEDTHWNYFGGYIGYQEIMKTLAKNNHIKPYKVTKWKDEEKLHIDLSKMYSYGYRDRNIKYKEPIMTDKSSTCESIKEENLQDTIVCHNPKQKLKAFVLRDSFSTALIPYYAETFGKVKLVWRYDITSENLQEIAAEYDIVILENVARFIPKILNKTFPEE
jgi:hypothetical protein